MRYFPQLSTGALGQYPIRRRRITRTVANECADGRKIKLADAGGGATEWTLAYEELTDQELDTLAQFFASVEGRLESFALLDPTGNLLCWSGDLEQPAWETDPLLEIAAVSDGFRITNPTAALLRIQQAVSAPAWFYYSLSARVKSDAPAHVVLCAGGSSGIRITDPDWKTVVLSAKSESLEEIVRFGIEIPAGASVYIAWVQAEAQIGASPYKPTMNRGGVYPGARFGSDSLEVVTSGPGRHACVLNIIHADHL
jgi:hypothetical protein